MQRSIRLQHWLKSKELEEMLYDKKIYKKTNWIAPPIEDGNIELRMMHFANAVQEIASTNKNLAHPKSNLNFQQARGLKAIAVDPTLHIFQSDKNCGLGVTKTNTYEKWCWDDHLNDLTTYREIPELEARSSIALTRLDHDQRIKDTLHLFQKHEHKFFTAVLKQKSYKLARFYANLKVHKRGSRGLIDNKDTYLQESSKWCDTAIQALTRKLPTRLSESFEMIENFQDYINSHGSLPPYARFF